MASSLMCVACVVCLAALRVLNGQLLEALCTIEASSGDPTYPVTGTVYFSQMERNSTVGISINLSGLNNTDEHQLHGFHIHETGSIDDACAAAGSHFNPLTADHGGPDQNMSSRHVGDLGNLDEEGKPTILVYKFDDLISLEGNNNIIGRSVVFHEKEDDLGLGGDDESKKTGNAGKRLGCCVIEDMPGGGMLYPASYSFTLVVSFCAAAVLLLASDRI